MQKWTDWYCHSLIQYGGHGMSRSAFCK